MKNSGGQVQSCIRTLHFGKHWADLSGSRGHGLPNFAFVRSDSQSDLQQALLSNPFFYVTSTSGPLDALPVVWSCRGSLLWSLSSALCFAPLMMGPNPDVTLSERCENAISGFIIWDLWQILSSRKEADSQQGYK